MFCLFRRKQFKKDLKKLMRNEEFDLGVFENILSRLVNEEKLEDRFRNHRLAGEYSGCYECHVQPDTLLIYAIDKKVELVYLVRIGSHAELFG